jgi:RNA polymerase sigma-70 factor (ECF subfamily)
MLEQVTPLMAGSDGPTMLVAKLHGDDLGDAVLVSLAAVGRAEAHTAIWDRYAPLVRSIVRRSIRPASDVDDLVQEVFLQFYRSHKRLRNRESLRSYIFAISLRVTIRELRFRRALKRERLTDDGGQELGPRFVPPADFEAREAVAGLRAMLDRLDPKDQTAFVLRHVEGLELTEVARMLDVSLATAKRRLGRIAQRVSAMSKSDQRLIEYWGKFARTDARVR